MMNWRRFNARIAYRRDKIRDRVTPEFSGFCLTAASLLGFYCTLWPKRAGVAGAMLARNTLRAFGQTSYLLWALLGYRGIRLIFHREERRPWRYLFVDGILVLAASALVTSFSTLFMDRNFGCYSG